eukprot:TRINITY_DN3653_c0_g1_i4.p1 TRINITY_DN3653_c0_g1~~TRINITY_DN3653_c0_g1_i4.p1  ORF type:complete len:388 (-),score=109.86 TRINITY_DN3653_c0_g1_i4:576-1739(-)
MDPSFLATNPPLLSLSSTPHPEPLEPRVYPSPLPPMPYHHPLAPLHFTSHESQSVTLVHTFLAQAQQQLAEHQLHMMNLAMNATLLPDMLNQSTQQIQQTTQQIHHMTLQIHKDQDTSPHSSFIPSIPTTKSSPPQPPPPSQQQQQQHTLTTSDMHQDDNTDTKMLEKTRRSAKEMEANLGVWTLSLQPGSTSSKSKSAKHGQHGATGKPMNAFLLFCAEHRPTLRRRDPFVNNNDTSRALGVMWRQLTEQEKELYHRRSQQLRAEHWVDSGLTFFSASAQSQQQHHSSANQVQKSSSKNRQQVTHKVRSDAPGKSKEKYADVHQSLEKQSQFELLPNPSQKSDKIPSPSPSSGTSLSSTSATSNPNSHPSQDATSSSKVVSVTDVE